MKSATPFLAVICAAIAILMMVSCQDDELPPPVKTCPNSLPIITKEPCNTIPTEPNGGFKYKQPNRNFLNPYFSPHNSCEFIVVKGDYEKQITELVKYDLGTNTEEVIIQFHIWSQPKWSIKDWVVFHSNDQNIWKVKIKGDSLTRLTSFGGTHPDWSPDGGKIVFKSGNKHSIIDENGNLLSEIEGLTSGVHWSPDGMELVSVGPDNLTFYDLGNNQISTIVPFQDYVDDIGKYISPTYLTWFPDGQRIVWSDHAGSLFSTNRLTEETKLIKKGCNPMGNLSYISPSIATDTEKILATRYNSVYIAPDTLYVESVISLFNIDGSEEVIIRPEQ
jgi:WD40-like Beta Propeller Repeat